MNLTERINRDPVRERLVAEGQEIVAEFKRRQPEWIRRMQEQGLPNVDTTARIYSDGCGPTGRAA